MDSKFYANGGGQGGAISLWNSSLLVNGTTFYRNQGNGAGVASCIALTSMPGCESTAEDARQGGKILDEVLPYEAILQQPSVPARHDVDTGRLDASPEEHVRGGHVHSVIGDAAAGGAIAVRNASTIQIITSAFTENVAENGGAVYLETCGKASLADNTFTSNRANKQGGGLFQTKCSGRDRHLAGERLQTQLDTAVRCPCFTSFFGWPKHPL